MELPAHLAQALLRRLPTPVLRRVSALILALMQRRHPGLFEAIARLPPSTLAVVPTDLPHHFQLEFGGGGPFLLRVAEDWRAGRATVKGPLEALLDLLSGRKDGDALFFDREITLLGDASVLMALRNTMDREELDLAADLLSALGPFATPMSRAVHLVQQRLNR